MHPRITELLDHLRHHHHALLGAIDQVPAAMRHRRPAPESWSVTEVMQHLVIVNGWIARHVSKRSTAARSEGVGPDPDTSPIVPTFDIAGALDRDRKVAAPAAVRPQEALDEATARGQLDRAHAALLEAVRASDGVNLVTLITPHPLFGPMNLYEWIVFAGAHESRHAAQVSEIGAALSTTS